mgnify:CR=1 FL=1
MLFSLHVKFQGSTATNWQDTNHHSEQRLIQFLFLFLFRNKHDKMLINAKLSILYLHRLATLL